jgi:hypothetical protein
MLALLGYLAKRNNVVYEYRHKLIDFIYDEYRAVLNKQDLTQKELEDATTTFSNRIDEFDRVSYDTMVKMFWKKIDSFYNKDILQ